jgi:hypothetical protein
MPMSEYPGVQGIVEITGNPAEVPLGYTGRRMGFDNTRSLPEAADLVPKFQHLVRNVVMFNSRDNFS